MAASGKYAQPISGIPCEAHLDVDGNYPQMKISFNIGPGFPAHWIADLALYPGYSNIWEGPIWYRKDGANTATVNAEGVLGGAGGAIPDKIQVQYGEWYIYVILIHSGTGYMWYYWYPKVSEHFREVEVETDYETGLNPITSLNPHSVDAHCPPSVPNEDITVASTYLKAGIKVNESVNANAVPSMGTGWDALWSNNELHDAMQVQWSKTEAAQWAMWVFQAGQHEQDHTGIMFDSIGSFQRCGTALFHGQSSYTGAPAGLVNRHKFHTLIHEMGHSFNLYHSWMKTSGTSNWCNNVVNEPEARSYMNYPDRVAAGYYGFFDTFEYRFSNQELLFLRHAPASFVQPGGSAWGTDHAGSAMGGEPGVAPGEELKEPEVQKLQLTLGSGKAQPVYEYLELVNLELKLKNVSDTAQQVPEGVLGDLAHMHIRISRNGQPVKEFRPYATPCAKEDPVITLQPGEAIYDSFFLSSGKFGWAVSEPGVYQVIVCLHSHTEDGDMDITSQPFMFTVSEPSRFDRQKRREQEALAQDVFTDDVGRALAFNGTKVLTGANEVLQELAERFPEAKAAVHAKVALAMPNTKDGYKVMTINADGSKGITPKKANPKEGAEVMKKMLVEGGEKAAETMGNVAFQKISEKAAKHLKAQGNDAGAKELRQNVLTTMEKRGVKLPEKVKKDLEAKVKG